MLGVVWAVNILNKLLLDNFVRLCSLGLYAAFDYLLGFEVVYCCSDTTVFVFLRYDCLFSLLVVWEMVVAVEHE